MSLNQKKAEAKAAETARKAALKTAAADRKAAVKAVVVLIHILHDKIAALGKRCTMQQRDHQQCCHEQCCQFSDNIFKHFIRI